MGLGLPPGIEWVTFKSVFCVAANIELVCYVWRGYPIDGFVMCLLVALLVAL